MIKLGNFYLDVEEMLLIKDQQSRTLEPKVLAVLLYLIDNNERYISMAELHENLWQGRVVSDAAVRRIVSKLRVLFDDDHKSPKYLKSLPKRGYKLICSLEYNAKNISAEQSAFKNHALINTATTEITLSNAQSKLILLAILVVALILLVTIYFFSNDANTAKNITITDDDYLKTTNNSLNKAKVILTSAGVKLGLAQSADKQYLAYSGENSKQGGYQIFLKKSKDEHFKPITSSINYPYDLAFSKDNKYLFYNNFVEGDSSVNVIDLKSLTANKVTNVAKLLGGFYIIGEIFAGNDANYVYFGGQKTSKDAGLIYQLNRLTHKIKAITAAAENKLYDVSGAISPNGRYLAVIRKYDFSAKNEVRVIDLNTNQIVFRYSLATDFFNLAWQNEQVFLLMADKNIKQINFKTNQVKTLYEGLQKLVAFVVDGNNHVLALRDSVIAKPFIEHSLPFSRWDKEQRYVMKKDIYSVSFDQQKNNRLVVESKNNSIKLSQLTLNTRQLMPLINANSNIDIVDVSSDGHLLLRIGKRFALFNRANKKLLYIMSADQFVGDVSFATTQQSILFSVRDFNGWHIQSYDINSQQMQKLFVGYRFIRPYGDNYIVGDAEQNLYFYNNTKHTVTNLNHKISVEPNTNWMVVNNYIYWSTMDLVNTQFHQLDISDLTAPQETIKTFNFNKVRPDFSIDKSGTKFLYAQKRTSDSELVVLSLKGN